MKSLFGTPTVADLGLHVTLEDLKSKQAVISHALNGQISYIKGIALNSRINSDAIAKLSTICKTGVIQLHNRYTQLANDAWQFNVTFVDYSSLVSLIRQIEFDLLQMAIQIDKSNMAVQNVLTGKLPIAILKPNVLHDIFEKYFFNSRDLSAGRRHKDREYSRVL